MPLVLVISSYVAGSRVGAAPAAMALGALKIDPIVVPTTLLGRHPGWGPPGGGPVAVETMRDMLDAIAAQGLFDLLDGVLTGYFAHPDQIALAASAITAIRAARPSVTVLVDPVIGDEGGLYVPAAVAGAIRDRLIGLANIVTPNLWELGWLSAKPVATRADILAAARALGASAAVTSIRRGDEIGAALLTPAGALAATTPAEASAPNGTGDLFAGALLAAMIDGQNPAAALTHAVAVCADIVTLAHRWQAPELPIVAAAARLAQPVTQPVLWDFTGDGDD
jgi:pyridoxine kinase